MDDSSIVQLYLNRDESAIGHTAGKFGQRLRTLAQGIVGDRQAAEECESDTYWEAWRRIPPQEPRDYLYAFLARITRHISIDRCRAQSRLKRSALMTELSAELEQCIPAPDDAACRLEELALREAINGFLATLDAQKRNLFLRRYWFCDSVAALSQRFGLSESNVKTTLLRCRNRLRAYLEKEGYDL